MAFKSGDRLGPYQIEAAIGAGGMGEVYKATDTRLHRTVALKVLASHLSSNPSFRERFEREAHAISALSHPHICALYDIGKHEETHYLVMEFLEGRSLADRLSNGPLPMEQVLRFGREIAEALDAAHRAGIVHRDLKPGNIQVTRGGVKLLDFGLARLTAANAAADQAGVSVMPTAAKELTAEGSILGTLQYMSPEQLEGATVDHRTDIFALGTILYEMATGRRAFTGKSQASLIAAILSTDPPSPSTIVPVAPPAFDRVVQTCLAKDPEDRWQSARDLASELKWIHEGKSGPIPAPPMAAKTRKLYAAILLGLLAGCLITTGFFLLRPSNRKEAQEVVRFTIPLPKGQVLFMGEQALAISPDGSTIAYIGDNASEPHRIYTRRLQELNRNPLQSATQAGRPLFFSPDGRWLGFTAEGKIKKVSLDGLVTADIVNLPLGMGASWAGNTIYYNPSFAGGIHAISDSGGTPQELLTPRIDKGYRALVLPSALPGGHGFLYTAWTGKSFDDSRILAYDTGTRKETLVLEGGHSASYSESGHLLFLRGDTLFAAPMDPKKLTVLGTAVPVQRGLQTTSEGMSPYGISKNGTLVYVPRDPSAPSGHSLCWIDSMGKITNTVDTKRYYFEPVLSPDGRSIAFVLTTSTYDIWILDVERDSPVRITFDGDNYNPLWSPDGKWLYYASGKSGHPEIFRKPVNSTGGEEQLTHDAAENHPRSLTPDGRYLIFDRTTSDKGASDTDIWIMDLGQSPPREEALIATPYSENHAILSPDGRWIAYESRESGSREVYLSPFRQQAQKLQISHNGGALPRWARDGKSIFYVYENRIYSVSTDLAGEMRIGKPRVLLEDPRISPEYDVAADGRILSVITDERSTHAAEIGVVLNFFSEIKRAFQQ